MAIRKKNAFVEEPEETTESVQVEDSREEIEVSEDDVEESGADTEEQAATRRQRRSDRGRKWREEVEERARQAEERARAAELQVAQARGYFEAQQRAQPHEQVDPDEAELKEITRQQKEAWVIWEANGARMTPQERGEFEERAQQLRSREHSTRTRLALRQHGIAPQADPNRQMAQMRLQMAVQTHAMDIAQAAQRDPRVWRYGHAELQRLVAAGYPDNEETLKLAAENTRKQFGMPTRAAQSTPRPSPPRHSLGGVASSGHAGGPEPIKVVMTPSLKKLAEARYPELEPEAAHKKWAGGAGLRAQKRLTG